MKKFILIAILISATISTMVMAMGSKQNNWFEQFKKAEDAERELIKLFPKEVEYLSLKNFLLQQSESSIELEDAEKFIIRTKVRKFLNPVIVEWVISVKTNNNKIKSLQIKRYLTGP